MTKARSFKEDHWTAFDKGAWTLFVDDFIEDQLAFKITKATPASTFEYKDSININKEGKAGNNLRELRVWFPIKASRTLYFRLKSDTWKAHLDNGVIDYNGYDLNLYGSVSGKRENITESVKLKLGLQTAKDNWSTNFRVNCATANKSTTVFNKTSVSTAPWRFGFINSVNTSIGWSHSSLQVSRSEFQWDFFLQASSDKQGKKKEKVNPLSYLQAITATVIHNHSPFTRMGLQLGLNLLNAKQPVNYAAGILQHKVRSRENTAFKLKADNFRNVSLAIKNDLEGYGQYNFGINISDFGQGNRFGYGIQIELDL